ncbi:MAG: FtsX-like permease family protein [Bryobacteraceae bacterium]
MPTNSGPASQTLSLGTAGKIALRDWTASRGKFLLVALAVAVGVSAIAGVRGFGRAFRAMLRSEARTLMAADLSVRVFDLPTPEQIAVLDDLTRQGARRTQVTETLSMMSIDNPSAGDAAPPPALISLKAVDPAVYPFYGTLALDPAVKLDAGSIAIAEDVMVRLPVRTGSRVRIGDAVFRIAAITRGEPDRMTGSLNVGLRVLMTREGLDRAGIIGEGSRAAQRHLIKADPEAMPVEVIRDKLKAAFPGALIADYRETHPLITRGLDRSERFLSLVSLIALIIGALGVAATMRAHIEQRLNTIAILKCLGARSGQVSRIYLIQTLATALAGALLGCAFGAGVQAAFPLLIQRYFAVAPPFRLDPIAALEALAIGMLTATLFTWPALLAVERIRPLAIFRRNVEPLHSGRGSAAVWMVRVCLWSFVGLLAAYLTGGHPRTAAYFAGGLLTSLAVLGAFAWMLLRGLRRLPLRGLSSTLRHGVANLHRPGNQAQAVLVSLGVGVMFTLTIYLVQFGMLDQILASAPPDMPNVFLINITRGDREGVEQMLARARGMTGKAEVTPTAAARLEGDVPPRFRRTRGVTWRLDPSPGMTIAEGGWWDHDHPRPNLVCVSEEAARELGTKPGAHLRWTAGPAEIEAEVACVFQAEEVRMGGNMAFLFSPGTLDHVPLQYFAAIRMDPGAVAEFQRDAFSRFPSVTVINGADVVEIIQGVVDQIALVVRFLSAFAIFAGAIILAASVAATRVGRAQEVAILKTLGARSRRIATLFSVEFTVLGAAAGAMGSLLAIGFSNLLLTRLLDAKARYDWAPAAAAIVLAIVIANAAGWLASRHILSQKPLAVLRGE